VTVDRAACSQTVVGNLPGKPRGENRAFTRTRKKPSRAGNASDIDMLLPYGGFLFDWNSDDATVYIQRYTFRIQGGSLKPKFFHQGKGNQWLELYKAEILAMWHVARPLKPSA
jgi:hypothetical protein